MKKKKKAQLPFRLNILFIVVFLLFSVLILQLGFVQILNGEAYQEEIDRTIKDTIKEPVPRGKMYDRNQQVLVDNKPLYAITYTPAKGVQADKRLEVAEKLSQFMSMYHDKNKKDKLDTITLRDKKEYWYLHHQEEADSRISPEEAKKLDSGEEYQTALDRITEDEANQVKQHDLDVILIKKELDKAQTLTPQIIKNKDVTPSEYAQVAEHLGELPGINATTDWNRTYPFGDTLKSLFGSVTSQEEGILADKEAYYLTRGYSPNDRVGRSGLEEEYENLLRGRKEQIMYTTNKAGEIVDTDVAVKGKPGNDLVLTLDMEFQKEVDKILREELSKVIKSSPYKNRFANDALAVVMKPKTGELLAVAGQHYNRKTGKFENAAYKTLYDQYRPGSAVKGATVLSGYQSGVIKKGTTFYDAPIKIKGTEEKTSWKRSLGRLNDLEALMRSSNVYMFYIGMRMGGEFNYKYNQPITFNPESLQQIRNYFSQFGLGVPTRVDFPYEGTGYKGTNPPNLMDFAIGQYDTYTMMQLAQYVSTIANDGLRVKPHFLKEVREPIPSDERLGPVSDVIEPEALNQVVMDKDLVKHVQKGFHMVFNRPLGTAYAQFHGKSYDAAGKTGTAENEVYVKEDHKSYDTENNSLVGYAPFDDPEVAMAIIVPDTGISQGGHANNEIGARIMDTYFKLKKERAAGKEKTDDKKEEKKNFDE